MIPLEIDTNSFVRRCVFWNARRNAYNSHWEYSKLIRSRPQQPTVTFGGRERSPVFSVLAPPNTLAIHTSFASNTYLCVSVSLDTYQLCQSRGCVCVAIGSPEGACVSPLVHQNMRHGLYDFTMTLHMALPVTWLVFFVNALCVCETGCLS